MPMKRLGLATALAVSVVSACAASPSLQDSSPSTLASNTATAVPSLVSDSVAYHTPAEAVVAVALGEHSDIFEPRVTQIVGIYADQNTVDLRVELQAEGFCQWYGVLGSVEGAMLRWRAGPALPCDPTG